MVVIGAHSHTTSFLLLELNEYDVHSTRARTTSRTHCQYPRSSAGKIIGRITQTKNPAARRNTAIRNIIVNPTASAEIDVSLFFILVLSYVPPMGLEPMT